MVAEMGQAYRRRGVFSALCALLVVAAPVSASNVPASTNYRFDETSIGVSSLLESSSTNFRAASGAGDTGIGNSASPNFQTETGSDTSTAPNLTFTVTSMAADFGKLSPSIASTGIATFSVINYTSFGYVVQVAGSPPSYGNSQIDAMSASAPSQPGTEQFGINLAANTSPTSFGANPINGTAPNDFGFGQAATNYDTANQYRYVSGETIALAPKSSGKTDYTISYLVNVASLTAGGTYGADQTLIVTGTY